AAKARRKHSLSLPSPSPYGSGSRSRRCSKARSNLLAKWITTRYFGPFSFHSPFGWQSGGTFALVLLFRCVHSPTALGTLSSLLDRRDLIIRCTATNA